MNTRAWLCATVGLALGSTTLAGGPGSAGGLYVLQDGATFQQGCFAPCLCPIMMEQPMVGSFRLHLVSSDPLFDTYAVSDVHWLVPALNRQLTGGGIFRIGGEVAVTQQLTLDLFINGAGRPTHFDSGLVAGPSEFPRIDLAVSIHGMYCYDTVLSVVARPCRCDWDGDGVIAPTDIAEFVSAWSSSLAQGTLDADFDGNRAVQPADVASFVESWFGAINGNC